MPSRTTRSVRALGATALAAALLAGCSADPEEAESGGPSDDRFQVTVEHELSETEVPDRLERVVSVGLTEQDTLLALGVVPIAATLWYDEEPNAVWPWATEQLGDNEVEVLTEDDGINFELIAELAPDLIVGTNAGLTPEDYDTLSGIAPTIAHPTVSSTTSRPGTSRRN